MLSKLFGRLVVSKSDKFKLATSFRTDIVSVSPDTVCIKCSDFMQDKDQIKSQLCKLLCDGKIKQSQFNFGVKITSAMCEAVYDDFLTYFEFQDAYHKVYFVDKEVSAIFIVEKEKNINNPTQNEMSVSINIVSLNM